MKQNNPILIIGICGGSGSGKTTLQRRLFDFFSAYKPTIFSLDNYYKPIQKQFIDENGEVNFDLPTALDTERLYSDFEQLYNGNSIEVVEYHFNNAKRENVLLTLNPSNVIILEGLFVFYYQQLFKFINYSIFVDVDQGIQLDRRLYRDQELRGYSRESILYQWNNHVLPCYAKYLEPYKEKSNFIFVNNQFADDEFVRLMDAIKQTENYKRLVEIH